MRERCKRKGGGRETNRMKSNIREECLRNARLELTNNIKINDIVFVEERVREREREKERWSGKAIKEKLYLGSRRVERSLRRETCLDSELSILHFLLLHFI